MLSDTTSRGAVQGEGVTDNEQLPLSVVPLGAGVSEALGVFVGDARLVGVSEG